MTTFALVHGAWHDGSCWDPTATVLRERGHDVITMDLPCSDPAAGLEEYAATVIDAIADADDVVLVGHSLGGLTVPIVASRRPVRELVLLAALVPKPGVAMGDDIGLLPDLFAPEWAGYADQQIAGEGGSSSWSDVAAIGVFYHDCSPEQAAWAAGHLRPQTWAAAVQPSPLAAYPDVPTHAIVCTADRCLDAETCARLAEERFGARVTRLGGGHSPMIAQPEALADALTGGRA
jgi:pimeloyl-ACP methyl ester carboxylesterase